MGEFDNIEALGNLTSVFIYVAFIALLVYAFSKKPKIK